MSASRSPSARRRAGGERARERVARGSAPESAAHAAADGEQSVAPAGKRARASSRRVLWRAALATRRRRRRAAAAAQAALWCGSVGTEKRARAIRAAAATDAPAAASTATATSGTHLIALQRVLVFEHVAREDQPLRVARHLGRRLDERLQLAHRDAEAESHVARARARKHANRRTKTDATPHNKPTNAQRRDRTHARTRASDQRPPASAPRGRSTAVAPTRTSARQPRTGRR